MLQYLSVSPVCVFYRMKHKLAVTKNKHPKLLLLLPLNDP